MHFCALARFFITYSLLNLSFAKKTFTFAVTHVIISPAK